MATLPEALAPPAAKPLRLAGALSSCLLLAGCGSYDLGAWVDAFFAEPSAPIMADTAESYDVEVLAEGLDSPWAIAAAADGRLFITERRGRVRVFAEGRLSPESLAGLPTIDDRRQGGLMDVILDPAFAENGWIYLAYTVTDSVSAHTQVARFTVASDGLSEMAVIFEGVPGSAKHKHFGCRLAFGADGKLYITLGERGEGPRAQDLGDLNGKVLRLNPDGSIPEDNPFVGRPDARPEIFSYGHRNPQGLALQPETGLLWVTEHGPTWNDAPGGGDEVNILAAAGNYGWPAVHHRETAPGMIAPVLEYTPANAPAGAMIYRGGAFPAWRGDLLFATLVGESLHRVDLEGRAIRGEQILLEERFGRLRDVAEGADGLIYVITSDTDNLGPGRDGGDRLLRLVPKG